MQIDFSRMISDVPIAVHIPTKEHAELFLNEMKIAYPEKVTSWPYAYYEDYQVRNGGVCYCPYFNDTEVSMRNGSRNIYIDRGIKVLEFEEVLGSHELEIDLNEADICILLS